MERVKGRSRGALVIAGEQLPSRQGDELKRAKTED
jgi:hypothetical protein